MADPIRIDERLIGPLGPNPPRQGAQPAATSPEGKTFADTLRETRQAQAGTLKFSAHAQTRIQSRSISLGPADMQRIEGAVERAAGKGAKESLILLDQAALVVSIPNRTVITVVDQANMKQNVFTNIDSAVIA